MGKGSTFGGIGQQMGGGGYGAPQPMGGKGGYAPPSTRNVAAPNTTEPNAPQPMGGKGGYAPTSTRSNTFQPAVEQTPMGMYQRGFMGMMDGMYGGPRRGFVNPMMVRQAEPEVANQSGTPPARGFVNPMMVRQAQPEVANQSGTPPAPAPSETAAPNPMFDSSTTQAEFDRARGMEPSTGLGALSRQFGGNRMGGPRYVGGGYGGGYGYSPFYGPSYGGFSPFARDELRYMYKDGGEVK